MRTLFLVILCITFICKANTYGGYGSNQSLSNVKKIRQLIKFVIQDIQSSFEYPIGANIFKVLKVERSTRQLVAGFVFNLQLLVAETECSFKASSITAIKQCSLLYYRGHLNLNRCHVSIWQQEWLNMTTLTSINCSSIRKFDQKVSKHGKDSSIHRINYSDELARLQTREKFANFQQKFNKTYGTENETEQRFQIFQANMKKVLKLRWTEQGTGLYGVTEFSDLSGSEFKKMKTGLKIEGNSGGSRTFTDLPMAVIPANDSLPVLFDWRDKNVVTPVKNQGSCGSCWAFSVTGNIEGMVAVQKGSLVSLSEQELVDCDKVDHGCEGGLMTNAYDAIVKLGGLESEADYEYDGQDDVCVFNGGKIIARITGGVKLDSDEDKIASWLVHNGPVSIGINANAMQFYMGGVSHPWKFLCRKSGIDHGVLIVGFGVHRRPALKSVIPFWIVKNSWGPSWGEQGYYRVYRGDGTCGLNQMASSAVL